MNQLAVSKPKNWGQVLGGKRTYQLHKEIFDKGRLKAIRLAKERAGTDKPSDTSIPLSEELCEFLGAFIGDGFTNKYGRHYQTQIIGDPILDFHYYHFVLKPLIIKLFNYKPYIYKNGRGLKFSLGSKRIFEILTRRFNFPKGVKCYTVKIPEEIMNSEDRFIRATLIGMFNTDGGVGFDKRKIYKKPYIRINYTSASIDLIDQLKDLLSRFSINYTYYFQDDITQMIQINGEANVKDFIKKIGFTNKRHLDKIQYLL